MAHRSRDGTSCQRSTPRACCKQPFGVHSAACAISSSLRQRTIGGKDSQAFNINEPADYNPTPGTNAITNERVELFHQALARLPEDYATIIRLRNLEQLPFKEIADRLQRTVDSVSKLWFRAVVKFQQELQQLDDNSR